MARLSRSPIRVLVAAGVLNAGATLGCRDEYAFDHVYPRIGIGAGELDFGRVLLGTSVTRSVAVENTGTDSLEVCVEGCADVSRLLPENALFRVDFDHLGEDGAWSVHPGVSRQLFVTFTPGALGPAASTLILEHNAEERQSLIQLSGSAVGPEIELSAPALDFGAVTVGQRKELELTLTNKTSFDTPLDVSIAPESRVSFGTTDPSGIETPAGQSMKTHIPGDGSLTIKAWYRPDEPLEHQSALAVSFCPSCSVSVDLHGLGVQPLFELVPPLLDFGSLEEAQPATRTFSITNVGNAEVEVLSVERDPATSTEFQATPRRALPARLQPRESIDVLITYIGVTPGEDAGRIEVTTNAWDDPSTAVDERIGYVTVHAESSGPDIAALPSSIDFGGVEIGASVSRAMLLENSGNMPLSISSIQLNTTTPGLSFSWIPPLPSTVAPGDAVQIALSFQPNAPGILRGSVVVSSNDRDEGTLTLSVSGTGVPRNTCAIDAGRSSLTFGLVERGHSSSQPIDIRSIGGQPCSVSGLGLVGDGAFAITSGAVSSLTLPPGGSHRVVIVYAPAAYANHSAELAFTSNDPSQPMLRIPISGSSLASNIRVVPSSLDFHVVPSGCSSPHRYVTVFNTGTTLESIQQVSLDASSSPEFLLAPVGSAIAIPPNGQVTLDVQYKSEDVGTDVGALVIQHSAASVPVIVPLSGEGESAPMVTDHFDQNPIPADVLFVVDNSCSMEEEQANLGSNLSAFLSFAQAQGVDYRIAVTTTDVGATGARGAFVGTQRILDRQTPNVQSIFLQNVSQGIDGATAEQGLEAAFLALSDPMINSANAGFLRPDAALSIVIISDEEDQSARTRLFYESFLSNVKGPENRHRVSVSAIVGSTYPECSSPNGVADYGARYIAVAENTGGVVESICAVNWGQALTNIGVNTFGRKNRFGLSSLAVANTITVTVSGTPVPPVSSTGALNWSYDVQTNTVEFVESAVPPAYSAVDISYAVACLR